MEDSSPCKNVPQIVKPNQIPDPNLTVSEMIKMAMQKTQKSHQNDPCQSQNHFNQYPKVSRQIQDYESQSHEFQKYNFNLGNQQECQYRHDEFEGEALMKQIVYKPPQLSFSDGNFQPESIYEDDDQNEHIKIKNSFIQNNYMQNHQPGRNTHGKQYTEEFKKNFVRKLMEKMKGIDKSLATSFIMREADKIKVYPNEVAIWIGIYRIAFRVEAQNAKRQMTEDKAVQLVQECLIQYLNNNPQQKKYRFIRVANGSFRAIGIKKCTGDYWLKNFIKKYQMKIDPRIDLNLLIRGSKKQLSKPFMEDIFQKNDSQIDEGVESNQAEEKKKKLIRMIDDIIQNTVEKIFRDKAGELGLNPNAVKNWYRYYGRVKTLFNNERQFTVNRSQQQDHSPNSIQSGKSDVLMKMQRLILQFIRDTPNCRRSKIQYEANQILANLRVPELNTPKLARAWLNNLLMRKCVLVGQSYQLKKGIFIPPGKKLKSSAF